MTLHYPPFDPELAGALAVADESVTTSLTAEGIGALRETPLVPVTAEALDEAGIATRDVAIRSYDGEEIVMSLLTARGRSGTGPGIYYAHGGGMVAGTRWSGVDALFGWLHRYDAVVISVDYRLAPEFPDPTPVEDCYAGLQWIAEHAPEIGLDRDRLLLVGSSAGGGLAAGVSLLARDRGGPQPCGQLLMYPMLDDRDRTVSTQQFADFGMWDRQSNRTAWTALLGDRRGGDDVSIYAAPARATDLSNLPPTFVDCGSAEVFRDEDVAFASAIWAAGGDAELHVWPGGYHSFEVFAPDAVLSRQMIAARDNWVERILGELRRT